MAMDALRCNHLAPLGFKGLKVRAPTEQTDTQIHRHADRRDQTHYHAAFAVGRPENSTPLSTALV